MMQPMSTEARLRRLEDRAELAELIARYALAVDDRDLEAIGRAVHPGWRVPLPGRGDGRARHARRCWSSSAAASGR